MALASIRKKSFWCHEHRKRHRDELLIFADRFQRSTHVASNLARFTLLNPKRNDSTRPHKEKVGSSNMPWDTI